MTDFPATLFMVDGAPTEIQSAAARWSSFGVSSTEAASGIRSLDTSLFVGPEGDQYRSGLTEDLPPHLEVAGAAYLAVGSALSAFASSLSGAQAKMAPLTVQAPELWQALQAEQGRVAGARYADQKHARAREQELSTLAAGQPVPADPFHSDSGAASVAFSNARQAWNNCYEAAQRIHTDLRAAADACASAIREAAATRFKKNPHGLGRFVDGVKSVVRDHLDGLRTLSSALKRVSVITGTLLYNGVGHLVNAIASVGNAMANDPGDVAKMLGGMVLVGISSSLEEGGILLDCTGVGAVIGVPLNVVAAAGMVAGTGLIIDGAAPILRNAAGDDNVNVMHSKATSDSRGNAGDYERSPVETWRDPRTLDRHVSDHGKDFGAKSPEDYAAKANDFFHRGIRERLPTKIDQDGDIRIYDPTSNTFGIYDGNGRTRSFYKPDKGISYWNRQPGVLQ